jgi:hypothetical protein
MVFQKEKLLWMLSFGFVSGHDFSRAVEGWKVDWASAPAMAHPARNSFFRKPFEPLRHAFLRPTTNPDFILIGSATPVTTTRQIP